MGPAIPVLSARKAGRARRLLLTVLGMMPFGAAAAELHGPAGVIDGDTLVVAGETVHLLDVDAFERAPRCEGSKELVSCGRPMAQARPGRNWPARSPGAGEHPA